jgi:hypothetical protein
MATVDHWPPILSRADDPQHVNTPINVIPVRVRDG